MSQKIKSKKEKPPQKGGSPYHALNNTFKGNKSYLPSKPCAVCQKEMSWRAAWAKNWENILYCSAACRKNKGRV